MELIEIMIMEIYKVSVWGGLMPYAPMFNFGSVRFGGRRISLDLGDLGGDKV